MISLDRHNLTPKLREVFIFDDVSFFSTPEGSQIEINDLFHMALKFGSYNIFKYALTMGANPNLKDREGNSALYSVVSGSSLVSDRCASGFHLTTMFKELVNEYQCDPRDESENLLHIAVRNGLKNITKFLLDEKNFNVDEKESDGTTPLFQAVSNRRNFMAKMLLERNANANAASNAGMTPLWEAAYVKYPDPAMFDLLIEHKADPTTCYQKRKLVSFLWGQGDYHGHAAIIKHLKLDSHYVNEAIQEVKTRREAARKQAAEAEAARKQAAEAAEAARKQAAEAEAARKQAEALKYEEYRKQASLEHHERTEKKRQELHRRVKKILNEMRPLNWGNFLKLIKKHKEAFIATGSTTIGAAFLLGFAPLSIGLFTIFSLGATFAFQFARNKIGSQELSNLIDKNEIVIAPTVCEGDYNGRCIFDVTISDDVSYVRNNVCSYIREGFNAEKDWRNYIDCSPSLLWSAKNRAIETGRKLYELSHQIREETGRLTDVPSYLHFGPR